MTGIKRQGEQSAPNVLTRTWEPHSSWGWEAASALRSHLAVISQTGILKSLQERMTTGEKLRPKEGDFPSTSVHFCFAYE